MHVKQWLFLFLILALFSPHGISESDQFTPLLASALTPSTQPFLGTDLKEHIVYELVLTDANPTPAKLEKIEVIDPDNPSKPVAAFDGRHLLSRLRTLGNTAAQSPEIQFDESRLFLLDLTFEPGVVLPHRVLHRIELLGAGSPGRKPAVPVQLGYTTAPIDLRLNLAKIGPPLIGKGWVAFNGCCEIGGVHRATSLAVNGRLYFAQRFAIDWMRLDSSGRLVHGDASDVHNYTAYGADVLAVADGTVVDTFNTLEDQKPGTLPDPKTITLKNVDGNHVILDLGNGIYAAYAHLEKGSIGVAVGDRVKRGQVLGKLGNTGNSSAPHLHFQLMDGPSVAGANGLPYGIDAFYLTGQISATRFAAASGLEGDWGEGLLHQASPRHKQLPMNLAIVTFLPRGDIGASRGRK